MLLLVGLGNPGPAHAGNRHNVGFLAVDRIVERYRFAPWRQRFHGRTCDGQIGPVHAHVLKPETMMNLSGQSVAAAMRYYRLAATDVTVLYDEIDLALAKVRAKTGGGNAGHNGLKSIDAHIGRDYVRVRIGVGHPGQAELVAGYVLHDFSRAERAAIDPVLDAVAESAPLLATGDLPEFMTKVARLAPPPAPIAADPGAG
ncbi:MAG: aminoacyl-tRNA hydrolase [Alphaproteobacteria bacterium]|nr:aminoacyl-tRNA hydrolase [Alphaproteobacteria bacterium]